jgi:hypothetical protein
VQPGFFSLRSFHSAKYAACSLSSISLTSVSLLELCPHRGDGGYHYEDKQEKDDDGKFLGNAQALLVGWVKLFAGGVGLMGFLVTDGEED